MTAVCEGPAFEYNPGFSEFCRICRTGKIIAPNLYRPPIDDDRIFRRIAHQGTSKKFSTSVNLNIIFLQASLDVLLAFQFSTSWPLRRTPLWPVFFVNNLRKHKHTQNAWRRNRQSENSWQAASTVTASYGSPYLNVQQPPAPAGYR